MRIDITKDNAYYVCSRCGYKVEVRNKILTFKRVSKEEKITVISEKEKIKEEQMLPITKVICPNCGYDRAYYWEAQTRSGDEGTTQFFKCVKCGHVWRLYT